MRIRYIFPVQGIFRLSSLRSFKDGDAVITPVLTKLGTLRALAIAFPLPNWRSYDAPRLERNGDQFSLKLSKDPRVDDAEAIAKRIEARLTPFGVDAIDTNQGITDWIAESEEERHHADQHHTSVFQGVPESAHTLHRPGVLRAALRPRVDDESWDLQLAFYRAAWLEVRKFHHVKAFFYFFFFLEGLYGDSQIRSDALKRALLENDEFTQALASAIALEKSDTAVTSLEINQAISRIVKRRGFLFHNPSRRPEKWSPDESGPFADDTMLLANTALRIVRRREWPPSENALPNPYFVIDSDRISFDRFLRAEADSKARSKKKDGT